MAARRLRGLLAALLVGLMGFGTASERPQRVHNKGLRQQREDAAQQPSSGIEMELVVARFRETDLQWLGEIPKFYDITIYNKGGDDHPMPDPPEGQQWDVIPLKNVGREANTFSEHLVRRYDTLADYTIFTQADPFVHNKHYLELLRNPALLGGVQTMSRVYKADGDHRYKTPEAAVEKMSRHPWYRSERLSTRTMNSVWYHDEGTVAIMYNYLRQHNNLPLGTNIIRHHFELMGLPHWIPEDLEVGSFAFGGLVGFEKSRALQHPKRCYELLLNTTRVPGQGGNAWVIERMWVMMFGGPHFRDV